MSRIVQWSILAAVCILGCPPAPAQDAGTKPNTAAPAQSASPTARDDDWTKWIGRPDIAPYFDLQWRPLDMDFNKSIGGGGLRDARDAAPMSGATNPSERFSLGNNYLGIQTQKALQDPFRQRTDCATDDECAEYSGVPKPAAPAKKSLKTFKTPFMGLSVTRPIQ
jgi:hypothetical protein